MKAMISEHFSTPLTRRRSTHKKRKPKRSRLVRKDGECNVYNTNVPKLGQKYLRDIFTTLIDVKWRWILLYLSLVFMTSWLTFAVTYYTICYLHGDIAQYAERRKYMTDGDHFSSFKEDFQHVFNETFEPCVSEVHSFLAAFLFSVETQHTIGYGTRHVTTACPVAAMTVCLQSLCGLVIQSLLVGLVFSKMARPKKRAETLIFSEKAVISLRDSQLCFLIRVADMRMTHLVEAHIRVQFITSRMTEEGEVEPLYQHDMDVGYEDGEDRIFLVWPITVCHVIDKESPLYNLSERDLISAQFEVVVILEGIVESTGMTAQARTSYLPTEILWGHRFAKLVTYQKFNGSYQIDYSLFHNTYPVNTPRCSARDLTEMKRAGFYVGCDSEYFYKNDSERDFEHNLDASDDAMTPTPSEDIRDTPPDSYLPSSSNASPIPRSALSSPTPNSIKEEGSIESNNEDGSDVDPKSMLLGMEASNLNPWHAAKSLLRSHEKGNLRHHGMRRSSNKHVNNNNNSNTSDKENKEHKNEYSVPQIVVNSPTTSNEGLKLVQRSPLIEKTKKFFSRNSRNLANIFSGITTDLPSPRFAVDSDTDVETENISLDVTV